MFASFAPGPIELVLIAVILLVPVGVVVALVEAFRRRRRALGGNPNLEPCPDCGRFASRRTTNCPQCGCPLQGQQ